jgi:arylformamidase
MTQTLIDISPLVSERIGVWPGDVPFARSVGCRLEDGDSVGLSSIRTTLHVGAHADAPSHYRQGSSGIAERSLDRYYGTCQVIAVQIPRGARIMPEHITVTIQAPRVLFCTGSFPDPDDFNTDFNSLSPELVAWLHDRGVGLVGIDTPSIDPCQSKALETHNSIADRDMAVLEGLVLEAVTPGLYTLIALPLKLEGADASPVRAALVAQEVG